MAFEKVVPLRRRATVLAAPIKVGVAATVRRPKNAESRKVQLELKLNVDVLDSMRLMIGDRLDVYFDKDTNRIAFERHPNGEIILRPWCYRKADYTGATKVAGRINMTDIPNLRLNEQGQFICNYIISPEHPNQLIVNLPKQFFGEEQGVLAQVIAA